MRSDTLHQSYLQMAGAMLPAPFVLADNSLISCETCLLRKMLGAPEWSSEELEFIRTFKQRHGHAKAGTTLFEQGGLRPRLFTLFSGWALRSRTYASGEIQVLEVNLPGDLIGLSSVFLGTTPHWVVALTDITFCEFDAARVQQLLSVDSLAYQVTWHEEIEARHLDERLASVGALDTKSRVAFFLAELYFRLENDKWLKRTSSIHH